MALSQLSISMNQAFLELGDLCSCCRFPSKLPVAGGGGPDLRYHIVEEILDLLEVSCAEGPVA
jgi:hypothetical protein